MNGSRVRAIGGKERSGVLRPGNLERFSAVWVAPADDVREIVDTYWAVSWNLNPGESIEQLIIDHPAVTFSVERGAVVAPYVVTAVRSKAWSRTISGSGDVFAVRLRPAGLAVLSTIDAASLTGEQEMTPPMDHRAHHFLRQIEAEPDVATRAQKADALVRALVDEHPLHSSQRLANAAVDAIVSHPARQKGNELALSLGVSVRTLQRALSSHVGRGPGEIARRVRLQEVVRRLSVEQNDIARIAIELGYVDQAHLTNDFRRVANMTPGAYIAALARSQTALDSGSSSA